MFEALAAHHVPLPVETLIIERPPAPRTLAPELAAPPSDAAEDLDRAFLDEQLRAARATTGERDLLDEGARRRPIAVPDGHRS